METILISCVVMALVITSVSVYASRFRRQRALDSQRLHQIRELGMDKAAGQYPLVDAGAFQASCDLFLRDLARNEFFQPPGPLEFSNVAELVGPDRLTPELDAWKRVTEAKRIVADPSVDLEQRVGAALALREIDPELADKPIRFAADACADKPTRIALLASLEDDRATEEALAAAEEKAVQQER